MNELERIIVMAKNEIGALAGITEALAKSDINIVSINAESVGDAGVVIVTTEDNDAALTALTNAGFKAVMDDSHTMVVRLRDEPGALAKVADRFRRARIDIRSLHIFDRRRGITTVALSVDERDRAMAETLVNEDSRV